MTKKKPTKLSLQTPRLGVLNWALLGAALVLIALGFFFLSRGSITLAPLLLVLGYCVAIPLALLLRPKQKKEEENV